MDLIRASQEETVTPYRWAHNPGARLYRLCTGLLKQLTLTCRCTDIPNSLYLIRSSVLLLSKTTGLTCRKVELGTYCVLDDALQRSLIYLTLGCVTHMPITGLSLMRPFVQSVATNFADTLASELGILATTQPVHVFTMKSVPPGTNGAVTPYGLVSSAVGGMLMGAVFALDLYLENGACSAGSYSWMIDLSWFGLIAGIAGSMVSSQTR